MYSTSLQDIAPAKIVTNAQEIMIGPYRYLFNLCLHAKPINVSWPVI